MKEIKIWDNITITSLKEFTDSAFCWDSTKAACDCLREEDYRLLEKVVLDWIKVNNDPHTTAKMVNDYIRAKIDEYRDCEDNLDKFTPISISLVASNPPESDWETYWYISVDLVFTKQNGGTKALPSAFRFYAALHRDEDAILCVDEIHVHQPNYIEIRDNLGVSDYRLKPLVNGPFCAKEQIGTVVTTLATKGVWDLKTPLSINDHAFQDYLIRQQI